MGIGIIMVPLYFYTFINYNTIYYACVVLLLHLYLFCILHEVLSQISQN